MPWEKISPAVVASVAVKMKRCPVGRSRDLGRRVFTRGWDVAPRGDHVEVKILDAPEEADSTRNLEDLSTCEAFLLSEGYDVKRMKKRDVVMIGGPVTASVLEVRKR